MSFGTVSLVRRIGYGDAIVRVRIDTREFPVIKGMSDKISLGYVGIDYTGLFKKTPFAGT